MLYRSWIISTLKSMTLISCLKRQTVKVPVGPLQLRLVQVAVELGEFDKSVHNSLRDEAVREPLEVELSLASCPLGIAFVVGRFVGCVLAILLLRVIVAGRLCCLLLPTRPPS